MADKPFVYVCSPYRGDVEVNVERAQGYCREVFEAGYIPLAPHLLFPQFLNDDIPDERKAGLEMGTALLSQCRALVVCGEGISEGMAAEIQLAKELGIEVCALENLPAIYELGHTFSAYIANAEDYKNGKLVGAWLPLPAAREEFSETLAAIGVDGPEHPGWFVEKYQSGFESIRLLPEDSDINELNYLALNLERLSDPYKGLFDLAMLSGEHENTVRYAINVIENIDCFGLQAIYSPEEYGKQLAAVEQRELSKRLKSLGVTADGHGKEILASMDHLGKNTDYERLGLERAAAEDGIFTKKGYLSIVADFREVYYDPADIPNEHRLYGTDALMKSHADAPPGRASVMEQIAASRTERAATPEKPAPDKPRKSHSPEL